VFWCGTEGWVKVLYSSGLTNFLSRRGRPEWQKNWLPGQTPLSMAWTRWPTWGKRLVHSVMLPSNFGNNSDKSSYNHHVAASDLSRVHNHWLNRVSMSGLKSINCATSSFFKVLLNKKFRDDTSASCRIVGRFSSSDSSDRS